MNLDEKAARELFKLAGIKLPKKPRQAPARPAPVARLGQLLLWPWAETRADLEKRMGEGYYHAPVGYPCWKCGKAVSLFHRGVQESIVSTEPSRFDRMLRPGESDEPHFPY